jgi:hypothetical protein
MPAPTGATIAILTQDAVPNSNHVILRMTGTYTAADFEITAADGLGFTPVSALVLNLTDKNSTKGWTGSATGLKDAAGTPTYAAHGITFGERKLGIDVSVAGPITDNDVVIIEAWG